MNLSVSLPLSRYLCNSDINLILSLQSSDTTAEIKTSNNEGMLPKRSSISIMIVFSLLIIKIIDKTGIIFKGCVRIYFLENLAVMYIQNSIYGN